MALVNNFFILQTPLDMSTFCAPCHTDTFVATHDEPIFYPSGNSRNSITRFTISSPEVQDTVTEMPALRQTFGSVGTPFRKLSGQIFPKRNEGENNLEPKSSIGNRILTSFVNLFLDPIFTESQPAEVG